MRTRSTDKLNLVLIALLVVCGACRSKRGRDAPEGTSVTAPVRTPSPSAVAPVGGWGVAGPLRFLHKVSGSRGNAPDLPMIVAVHGLGDTAEHFAGLLDTSTLNARLIFLQAPTPYGRGFGWFPYRARDNDERQLAEGIDAAADLVADAILALKKAYPLQRGTVVAGFSQGGMISYAIAVRHPALVQAVFPIGGYLPAEAIGVVDGEAAPPIFAFHGTEDQVVPYRDAAATEEFLESQGFTVTLTGFPGIAHGISPEMRVGLLGRIASVLVASRPPDSSQ